MLNYKHPRLAQGQWQKFSLSEQMANIGSEVERCFKWKRKKQMILANQAFERAVELLSLTILSYRTDGAKLKELLRVKECLIRLLLTTGIALPFNRGIRTLGHLTMRLG